MVEGSSSEAAPPDGGVSEPVREALASWLASVEAVLDAADAEAERLALDARSQLRYRAHRALHEGTLAAEPFARAVIGVLEPRSRRLFAETSLPEVERARRLGLWREESLWLRACLAPHLPGAPLRPFEELTLDLDWLRARAEASGGPVDWQGEFRSRWRDHALSVSGHRDRVCLEHFEAAAQASPEEAFDALLMGWERFLLPIHPRRDESEARRLKDGREACRERLRRTAAEGRVEPLPSLDWVERLDQRVAGLVADLAGQRPKSKVIALEALADELEQTGAVLMGLEEGELGRAVRRRLRRRQRRVARELQESRLQARLEARFGVRNVARTERTILALIVLVVLLLIVEGIANLSPAAELTLHGIDTLICFVFLFEFGVRMALVQGRWSYFGRHALLDFVPAIPFGLLAFVPHLSGMAVFDQARVMRVLRFLRIVRLGRYVRAMRPALRLVRVFAFLSRAADRLVHRFSWLLDYDIVVFDRPTSERPGASAVYDELVRIQGRLSVSLRRAVEGLSRGERERVLLCSLAGIPDRQVLAAEHGAVQEERPHSGQRRIGFEDLIGRLLAVDADQVEDKLGAEAATRIDQVLRGLDFPVLRLLPVVRRLAVRRKDLDPFERIAIASQQVGRGLEETLARVHWVADLWGVVTGPLLLDRLGSAMVRASQRPAIRLLLFGSLFLLANLLVELFFTGRESWIEDGMAWLRRTLGIPIVVLGSICSVFYALGLWFKQLAGEATDSCQKTAEAQFINLLKTVKLQRRRVDLAVLGERVLGPERRARGRDGSSEALALDELATLAVEGRVHGHGDWAADDPREWQDRELLLLLYRDFLDGAILHRSDTKTTEQLLGNLTLEGIRREVLHLNRRDRARLRELDLDRARSLFRGPYLWFNFLTQSIALKTARLLMEYNRHGLPLDERGLDEEQSRTFDRWMAWRRAGVGESYEPPVIGDEGFVTTEFTALHFLTVHPRRDESVARRFGPEMLELLRLDRRRMIRRIFGTWPVHRLPLPRRTFNALRFYRRRLAGGRLVLLPFWIVWFYCKSVLLLLGRLIQVVRDVLNQQAMPEEADERGSEFQVVLRKINRMRKPVFMECMRLRAAFDVEYLGCQLSPVPRPDDWESIPHRFEQDLDFIGALDTERSEFEQYQQTALDQQRRLESFLRQHRAWPSAPAEGSSLARTEQLRAIAIAYHVDYQGLRTLVEAPDRLLERFERVLESPTGKQPKPSRIRRLGLALRPCWDWLCRRAALDDASFERAWSRVARPGWGETRRRACHDAWRANFAGIRHRVEQVGEETPIKLRAERLIDQIASRPQSWSRRLLTLRTVQTLCVLDIQNYRDLVHELGGYE